MLLYEMFNAESVGEMGALQLMVERERRRILLDYVRSLEDDKHLLETEVMGGAQVRTDMKFRVILSCWERVEQ